MGMRLFGYKPSTGAVASGTIAVQTMDVGVYPVSGMKSTGPGALMCCLYVWSGGSTDKWVPLDVRYLK